MTYSSENTINGIAKGEEFRIRMRGGLSPEIVRELSILSPMRATLSLVLNWGSIALFITAATWWPHPFMIGLAVLGIAASQHGLAVLAHESAHYRMYQTGWLNDLVGCLCAIPLGLSMMTYRLVHRIHHNHLYESIDPDLALIAGYPRGRLYLLKKLAKDLVGITVLKNYRYFFGKNALGSSSLPGIDDTSPRLKQAAARDRKLVIVLQVAALIFFIIMGWWQAYLLLWVLPLISVLQVILRLRAICEHGAVTDTTIPTKAARTTLVPFWIGWILFPHQVNYHIEHHLYPSVPHYRLAECHHRLCETGLLVDAEVATTLSATLRKIFASPAL
ncbi:MAG: fatty acid desaturase family protein [Acidobacteriota bacterium]